MLGKPSHESKDQPPLATTPGDVLDFLAKLVVITCSGHARMQDVNEGLRFWLGL